VEMVATRRAAKLPDVPRLRGSNPATRASAYRPEQPLAVRAAFCCSAFMRGLPGSGNSGAVPTADASCAPRQKVKKKPLYGKDA